jgi:selenocysteine lyase/cysteine desulfurase
VLTLQSPMRTDPVIAAIRRREFARLDRAGLAYLDYTGSALYGETQLSAQHARLSEGILGNPHSDSTPSRASSVVLERARQLVLDFLDADPREYTVCFTANTTGAIRLVAEAFPFDRHSSLVLAADNHNSVNGVREFARRALARLTCIPLDDELRLRDPEGHLAHARRRGKSLFAFPAQSNFSGVKHSLSLVRTAQRLGYRVLLDAASFLHSSSLSLREYPADFVALSAYKLFGYPTGVGALVARRAALAELRRPWFAGGTVEYASVQHGVHRLRADAEGFEDGTVAFTALAALGDGFTLLREVGIARVSEHVTRLTSLMLAGLLAPRHGNDAPLARVYGPTHLRDRGGTVAFNVLRADGSPIPYARVEAMAREMGVAVRGGCFCNPGASESAFGFDADATARCLRALDRDFSVEAFAVCLGTATPVGAVRASVGLATSEDDVRRLLDVVVRFAE